MTEVKDWRRRRVRFLLTKAERHLDKVTEDKEFWRPRFCLAFFDWCDDNAFDAPDLAVKRASVAVELAEKTNSRHLTCRAMGVLVSGHRMVSEFEEAKRVLKEALALADGCSCCLCDLYRRKGLLHLYQSENEEAHRFFNAAITEYEKVDDYDGVGRALVSRGISHFYLASVDAALADEDRALQLLSSESPQIYHLAALNNIAGFLALGDDHHFFRASQHLASFRETLKGVVGFSSVRVRLRWIDGLILARLGDYRPAVQMLENAQGALIRLRQDPEVVAISADLAMLYHERSNYPAIVRIANNCLRTLPVCGKVRALLAKLARSAARETKRTLKIITALRCAVDVPVPCLIQVISDRKFSNPGPST
ncbi:MAG: hypothetical protein GY836_13045 [Herbaspirillum sp.]|uniref:tetratricopeptide repeat protein n=1 Tax=Herbaspirillum sp. TaxID=1890675 RepID=UPI0025902E96|nr:hypothetical protein [Herbaspirillum sp.]MCP4556341.1 hypothetical protein [Herbaspirillum sp.]